MDSPCEKHCDALLMNTWPKFPELRYCTAYDAPTSCPIYMEQQGYEAGLAESTREAIHKREQEIVKWLKQKQAEASEGLRRNNISRYPSNNLEGHYEGVEATCEALLSWLNSGKE